MKKYIIKGQNELEGEIRLSGSKNVVLKSLVAACLTDEEVQISNVPLISDFYSMVEILEELGGSVKILDHKITIKVPSIKKIKIPLEIGAKIRTSSIFIAPLLARRGEAVLPNPGGCRIGARPIDRHIEGLEKMGAFVKYNSDDGYFYAKTSKMHATTYTFKKNTHTGTETLILASVLAQGKTVLQNAALEPEIDDLIGMLNSMGADICRKEKRMIVINGVKKLHGTSFEIMPDRNELVTYAILSGLTGGKIKIYNADLTKISAFSDVFEKSGGKWEKKDNYVRFYLDSKVSPIDVCTKPYPGFMTDWQAPWAVLMTQAGGESMIHETIYENRFGYVEELKKMGADIKFFNPKVEDPENVYNFNYGENGNGKHAVKIFGKTPLHNAIIKITDLRAGATLVIASLIAKGESVVYGIEHLERGYEDFDKRLRMIGANIKIEEERE